jgi:hypothetical protein
MSLTWIKQCHLPRERPLEQTALVMLWPRYDVFWGLRNRISATVGWRCWYVRAVWKQGAER